MTTLSDAGPTRAVETVWTQSSAAGVHLYVCSDVPNIAPIGHRITRECVLISCGTCQTSSCVPNSHTIPMLAPAYDENICPHWAERWEIRTRPFGCQVSTITSLTSLVSIASTVVLVLVVFLSVLGVRRLLRLNRERPGWLRRLRYKGWGMLNKRQEDEPLLTGDGNRTSTNGQA